VRRVACLAVLLALVPACGTGPAAPPPGLRLSVEQSRDNENRGLVQLVVANDGTEPVTVRRVQLRSPGYRPVPAAVFDDVVRPGSRTAFPVPLGEPDCRVDGTDGSAAVLGLRDGGSVQEVRLPVPEDDPALPRLHARACAVERVGRAADVAFSTGWVRDGDVVTGELVLQRRGAGSTVRVTDLQSSILFLLQPTGPLPLELVPGEDRARLPVAVRAVRCDPHALIESKRSYTFPVFVQLGEEEPLQLPVTADDAGRALMDSVLRDRCAAEGVDLGG
jgi:hypothetical protein